MLHWKPYTSVTSYKVSKALIMNGMQRLYLERFMILIVSKIKRKKKYFVKRRVLIRDPVDRVNL